jgi:hypothetical protein
LRAQGKPKLTPRESICLGSYATHLGEELKIAAQSDRILQLIEEDEVARFFAYGEEVDKKKNRSIKKKKKNGNRKEINKKTALRCFAEGEGPAERDFSGSAAYSAIHFFQNP